MHYRTILIDADDTIFDFYAAEEHALEVTLLDLGYTEPLDSYMPQFRDINARAWADYEAGRATSQEIRVRRFVELLAVLSLQADPEQVSTTYVGHLSESSFLLPGVRQALEALHSALAQLNPRGSMILLTNGLSSVQHPRIDAAGIRHFFDAIVVSEEVGVQKPDPQIFQLAMESASTDAHLPSTVMIGDGLHSDILGAVNAGMDSIWVNVRGKPSDPAVQPTHTVSSLVDALPLLGV